MSDLAKSLPTELEQSTSERAKFGRLVWLLLVSIPLLSGCGLLRAPQQVVSAVVPGGKSQQPDPVELQLQLQRFTDDFSIRTSDALDEYAQQVGSASSRILALQLKLLCVSSVTSIASGPNPNSSLLDLVSTVTLNRRWVDDFWLKTTNGPAFEPWSRASEIQENNVWKLASSALRPEQVEALRGEIDHWYSKNKGFRSGLFARPEEFAAMVKGSRDKGSEVNNVFSLVSLDPTSGLDPAVREVTRTRLFAERAMATMQRMPFLLRWQTELLAYQLASQPEVQLALTNTSRLSESMDRISRASESISQTAAQLPDRISTERKEILSAMDQQAGKLTRLASEVDQTLVHGEKMSTSLNTTIQTFDGLMKRFGVGEPSTNSAPDTNSPPFNILDYGQVAGQVGAMAKDLNTLISSADQNTTQMQHLAQQATLEAKAVVDHAFRLGLVLILFLLAGGVSAALAYRVLAAKIAAKSRGNS